MRTRWPVGAPPGDDGKLTFARKYDIDVGNKNHVLDGYGAAASIEGLADNASVFSNR
jgi:hypothetical protein